MRCAPGSAAHSRRLGAWRKRNPAASLPAHACCLEHVRERAPAGLRLVRRSTGFKVRDERGVAAGGGVAEALHALAAGAGLLAARRRLALLALRGARSVVYTRGLACPRSSVRDTGCRRRKASSGLLPELAAVTQAPCGWHIISAAAHLDEVQLGPVLAAPKHQALGRQAVAPGAPDLPPVVASET